MIVRDVTDEIQRKLAEQLKSDSALEQFWQKKLEKATGLRHERIAHGMITDLSNRSVLIEIKNGSGFREALGQIQIYAHIKKKTQNIEHLKLILVIFSPDWSDALKMDYETICKNLNINLVLMDQRNVIKNDFEILLEHLRPDCKQINFRERLEHFRHR